MRKILFVTQNFPPSSGGVQNYIYNTVMSLVKFNAVLLCRGEEPQEIDKKFESKGTKIIRNNVIPNGLEIKDCLCKPWQIVRFSIWVFKLTKTEDICGIIFGHNFFFYLFSILILKLFFKKKIGIIFHGEDIPEINLQSNNLMRFLISRTDILITNSHFTKNKLLQFLGGVSREVFVAYPGVEDKFFNKLESDYYKEKFDLVGKKVIYTVGRLDTRKGHDTVIRCLREIIKQVPNVKYLIGGKGVNEVRLQKLIKEYNLEQYVDLVGFIPEDRIIEFHQAGDVFVMPNRTLDDGDSEGFGIVFLEASASGKPVVGGKFGGVVDAVEDGVTGFLVKDDNEFIAKVVYLLKSPDKAFLMGEAGKKRANEKFRWDSLVSELEKKLENAFNKQ